LCLNGSGLPLGVVGLHRVNASFTLLHSHPIAGRNFRKTIDSRIILPDTGDPSDPLLI